MYTLGHAPGASTGVAAPFVRHHPVHVHHAAPLLAQQLALMLALTLCAPQAQLLQIPDLPGSPRFTCVRAARAPACALPASSMP